MSSSWLWTRRGGGVEPARVPTPVPPAAPAAAPNPGTVPWLTYRQERAALRAIYAAGEAGTLRPETLLPGLNETAGQFALDWIVHRHARERARRGRGGAAAGSSGDEGGGDGQWTPPPARPATPPICLGLGARRTADGG